MQDYPASMQTVAVVANPTKLDDVDAVDDKGLDDGAKRQERNRSVSHDG